MKADKLLIEDICNQAEFINATLQKISKDDLLEDMLYQNALIRSIEIMGEAAKRLSPEFRDSHPEIPLSEMARARDKMIHGYDEIDLDILWYILSEDVPAMYEDLLRL
ncbi:MAG TPA: DUF86 domain-containing protein [Methanocorpusculum sp.]|nr:DUF86 domain-containing protein [Methanocorpusculum sp.]